VWGGVYYATHSAGVRNARMKCALMKCLNGVRRTNPYCSFACEHKAKAGTDAGYRMHLDEISRLRKAGQDVPDAVKICPPCAAAKEARSRQRMPNRPDLRVDA
jgi:hypothetical protein